MVGPRVETQDPKNIINAQVLKSCHGELSCECIKPSQLVISNDPTAGSPTVTLLRLLVPLNDQV
jgi:hypothetical protein